MAQQMKEVTKLIKLFKTLPQGGVPKVRTTKKERQEKLLSMARLATENTLKHHNVGGVRQKLTETLYKQLLKKPKMKYSQLEQLSEQMIAEHVKYLEANSRFGTANTKGLTEGEVLKILDKVNQANPEIMKSPEAVTGITNALLNAKVTELPIASNGKPDTTTIARIVSQSVNKTMNGQMANTMVYGPQTRSAAMANTMVYGPQTRSAANTSGQNGNKRNTAIVNKIAKEVENKIEKAEAVHNNTIKDITKNTEEQANKLKETFNKKKQESEDLLIKANQATNTQQSNKLINQATKINTNAKSELQNATKNLAKQQNLQVEQANMQQNVTISQAKTDGLKNEQNAMNKPKPARGVVARTLNPFGFFT
jgi:hypothetical protein